MRIILFGTKVVPFIHENVKKKMERRKIEEHFFIIMYLSAIYLKIWLVSGIIFSEYKETLCVAMTNMNTHNVFCISKVFSSSYFLQQFYSRTQTTHARTQVRLIFFIMRENSPSNKIQQLSKLGQGFTYGRNSIEPAHRHGHQRQYNRS